jgi:hypothetical protein
MHSSDFNDILSQVWNILVWSDVNDSVAGIEVWLIKWERPSDKPQHLVLMQEILNILY